MVIAYLLSRETRQTVRALPRLVVTTGVVRELKTVLTSREMARVRSHTLVHVDFAVDGKPYCCSTLYLFEGNRHIRDVGQKFDFPPGQEVGVHYDPANPRLNALIVDAPHFGSTYCALVMAALFAILALVVWF